MYTMNGLNFINNKLNITVAGMCPEEISGSASFGVFNTKVSFCNSAPLRSIKTLGNRLI